METLELRYIPLKQARRWDQNPKRHDIDALIASIETHGFGDPPKYDVTLGALVYGNGRAEALARMHDECRELPRGIGLTDEGEWAVPVIFGVDAASVIAAIAFAIDHNHMAMLGGDFDTAEILRVWDESALQTVLEDVDDPGVLVTLEADDVSTLLAPSFDPVPADEQSRLDEKKPTVCPECGHEFHPSK